MKAILLAVFVGSTLLAIDADAHAPEWVQHSHGGGGVTQNVVAGPIKRRPVTNVVKERNGFVLPSAELYSGPGTAVPLLHVLAVFEGKEWLDPNFAKDKISGLDDFFNAYSGSGYAKSLDEYLTPEIGNISIDYEYDGYIIDDQVSGDGRLPADVAGRVCGLFNNGRLWLTDGQSSYVAILSSRKRPAGESCGWHGVAIDCVAGGFLLSFSYNLDDDAECGVHDRATGHSPGLAALANEAARALSDVRTDANFYGWMENDDSGNEVDDKCAWTFSVPYVTFPDGSKWKLQDLWSNKAYEAGTGAPNAWGQRGCVTAP